ncbi:MAG: diguanylate cyclase [Armatimonadetes bacterium]|nr:diguanylate cyclase [Armatimonadota bacterium]
MNRKTNKEDLIIDKITNLPLLSSLYNKIDNELKIRKEIGFLYFDIVQFKQLLDSYGKDTSWKLLKILGETLNLQKGKFFREEDIIAIGAKGGDYFIIFLISPPRHKEKFSINDLKIVSFRIQQKIHDILKLENTKLGIQEKIDFHTGQAIITPDPQLSIERIIYEAQKEATLKCQLEEIMAQFVSNVSHELRTPLTCIKGYVETLLDGAMQDRKICQNFLQIIYDETERLNRLINDLLDLSMIEAKQVEMHYKSADIAKIIKNTLAIIQPFIQKQKVNLLLDIPQKLPKINADEDRLKQVILNLLDNAVKYSSKRKKIKIQVRKNEWDLKVSIIDNGMGIPPKDLDRIFDRFYRTEKGRSFKSTGKRGEIGKSGSTNKI